MSDPKTVKELHKEARDYRYKKAALNIALLNSGLFVVFWILYLSDLFPWMIEHYQWVSDWGWLILWIILQGGGVLQRKWLPIPEDDRTWDRIFIGLGIALSINVFFAWICARLHLVTYVEYGWYEFLFNPCFYGIVGTGTWLAVGMMNYFCGPRKGYWFVHDDE